MQTKTAIALLLGACGSDGGSSTEPPSCQQAMTHYYDSGCSFSDDNGPISVNTATGLCRAALATPGCERATEQWAACLDSVPAGSTTFDDCDCSQEQEELLTCG